MTPAREPLNRLRILEAALTLVDREGGGALTMRRLGRELGVEAMSLYNHVAGRDDVLDGLSEVMVARIGIQAGAGGWEATLARFMHGIRAVARAHPAAFQLVGMRPLSTPTALPPVEALLGALQAGSFGPEAAAYAYRLATAFARGFALAEIGGFTLDAADGGVAADLPPAEFPHIVALAPHLAGFDRDAAFAFGVETIVAGLSGRRRGARMAT